MLETGIRGKQSVAVTPENTAKTMGSGTLTVSYTHLDVYKRQILELHLFPQFLAFAEQTGYDIELATYQNYYPDLTFISKTDPSIKFAVDLKTTYREENHPDFCNGFTLGSHCLLYTSLCNCRAHLGGIGVDGVPQKSKDAFLR